MSKKSSSKKAARKPAKPAKKANPQTTGQADEAVGKPAAKAPAKGAKATRTREQGVGLKHHPANKAIPSKAIIKRQNSGNESGLSITSAPTVVGDQSKVVLDVVQKRPVKVFLIGSKSLDPDQDSRLIYVEGEVSNGLMSAEAAKSKFAVLPNGTAAYNARGFDDVPAEKFDMLDIATLIEHNN